MRTSYFHLGFGVLIFAAAIGQASAQSACSCSATATRTPSADVLAGLLANRMACATLGSEQWQEWHDGAGLVGGDIVDYKMGPGAPKDPSKRVGSYDVTTSNTVRYDYGSGGVYEYEVCDAGESFVFCGARFGGRDIPNVVIGGNGLQSCSTVTPVRFSASKIRKSPPPVRPPLAPAPKL